MHLAGGLWGPTPEGTPLIQKQGTKPTCSLPGEKLSWNSHTVRPASPLGKDLKTTASGPLFHPPGPLGSWAAQ